MVVCSQLVELHSGSADNLNTNASSPEGTAANFYRTAAGAEIDLLLPPPGDKPWATEIKRSLTPKLEKGFYLACEENAVAKAGRLPRSSALPSSKRCDSNILSAASSLVLER